MQASSKTIKEAGQLMPYVIITDPDTHEDFRERLRASDPNPYEAARLRCLDRFEAARVRRVAGLDEAHTEDGLIDPTI